MINSDPGGRRGRADAEGRNAMSAMDAQSTPARDPAGEAAVELAGLLEKYAVIQPKGFSIDLASAHRQWDACMKSLGLKEAYRRMAEFLCSSYLERFGEPFLLTEACVAWEIQYHTDAYMAAKGYRHYSRNVTTLLFTRQALEAHCKEVDISLEDMTNRKQRLMFRYRQGIRDCYRGTEKDPFRR